MFVYCILLHKDKDEMKGILYFYMMIPNVRKINLYHQYICAIYITSKKSKEKRNLYNISLIIIFF